MSQTHIKDIGDRIASQGWTVTELANDTGYSALWEVSRPEKCPITLNFRGIGDAGVLPLDNAYACDVEGRPAIALSFSKYGEEEWQKNLSAFVRRLDAAFTPGEETPVHSLQLLEADPVDKSDILYSKPYLGRNAFDWGIDGQPRGEWMSPYTNDPPVRVKGGNLPTWVDDDIRQLAGMPACNENRVLDSGRIPLYICSLCRDLGCGCFAVRVRFYEDVVTWSDFTSEYDYEYPSYMPDPRYISVPVIQFDKIAYLRVLAGLLETG